MLTMKTLLALSLAAVSVHAEDPLLGTWRMNVEKSGDNLGINPPKSQTRTYRAGPNGSYELTTESVGQDGKPTSSTVRIVYGQESALPESTRSGPVAKAFGGFTHVISKRVDDRTRETTYLRDGKTVATSTNRISPDGKTMTIALEGMTPDGGKGKVTSVYEKQ